MYISLSLYIYIYIYIYILDFCATLSSRVPVCRVPASWRATCAATSAPRTEGGGGAIPQCRALRRTSSAASGVTHPRHASLVGSVSLQGGPRVPVRARKWSSAAPAWQGRSGAGHTAAGTTRLPGYVGARENRVRWNSARIKTFGPVQYEHTASIVGGIQIFHGGAILQADQIGLTTTLVRTAGWTSILR